MKQPAVVMAGAGGASGLIAQSLTLYQVVLFQAVNSQLLANKVNSKLPVSMIIYITAHLIGQNGGVVVVVVVVVMVTMVVLVVVLVVVVRMLVVVVVVVVMSFCSLDAGRRERGNKEREGRRSQKKEAGKKEGRKKKKERKERGRKKKGARRTGSILIHPNSRSPVPAALIN